MSISINASNSGVKRFHESMLEHLNNAVTHTEPLDKLAKVTFKTIGLISALIGKVSVAFETLASEIKSTADVIEGLCLVGRIKELACPDDQGKYFLKKSNNVKCADRIFLTAASVFKTINVGVKFALINLGKLGKFAIGKVPVMRLIPDTLIVFSSFFSVWDNKRISKGASKDLDLTNSKVEKWAGRSVFIDKLRSAECNHWDIVELKSKYETKVAILELEIKSLGIEANDVVVSMKAAALNKYKARLDLIANKNTAALADEFAKQNVSLKQRHWCEKQKNQQAIRNKAWFGTANGVSKICVITVATTATALGLATAPWVLSLAAASIAVDSLSLVKSLYELSLKKA